MTWCLRGMAAAVLLALAFYDRSLNPDFVAYAADYDEPTSRFEPAYRAFVYLGHLANLPFGLFFDTWILINAVLMVFCYRHPVLLVVALPNLIYCSQFLLGTQIRYSMAATLAVLALSLNKSGRITAIGALGQLLAALFHSGIIVFSVITLLLPAWKRLNSWSAPAFVSVCVVGSVAFSILLTYGLEFLSLVANKSSYVGTEFVEAKSTSSVLYAVMMAVISAMMVLRCKSAAPAPLLLGLLTALFVVSSSGVSVLGGRYMMLFWLLEPIIIFGALRHAREYGDRVLLTSALLMLTLSLCKFPFRGFHLQHLLF